MVPVSCRYDAVLFSLLEQSCTVFVSVYRSLHTNHPHRSFRVCGTKRECESAVNSKRPVNLDLGKFHFPLPAITSILHRISGIIIFVGVAFLLYGLQLSLSGEEGFSRVSELLDSFLAKLITWGILSALLYHLVAGIKHLFMDAGIGEGLESGRLAAKITLVVSVILIIWAGVWVWA